MSLKRAYRFPKLSILDVEFSRSSKRATAFQFLIFIASEDSQTTTTATPKNSSV